MAKTRPSTARPRDAQRRPGGSPARPHPGSAPKVAGRGEPDRLIAKLRPMLPIAAVVAGVAIFVYAMFFGTTEEEKVRQRLGALAAAVEVKEAETNLVIRAARLKDAFDELLFKEVTVRIPELTGAVSGRRDLVGAATQAASLWRWATIDVSGLAVALDEAETSAHATGEVMLQAMRQSGEPERDGRAVSIRLDKIDGDWLVVSIAVSSRQGEL